MIFLEGGNFSGLVFLILAVMFGPPLLLFVIGVAIRKKHKKASNVLFLLAVLYVLIGLGMCFGGA